jgi:hypothetical protein
MPDIAMCCALCKKSSTCYRHADSGTEQDEFGQTFFMGNPCGADYEYYWPIYTVETDRIERGHDDTR